MRRTNLRWRVTIPALSIARWVHISTIAMFPQAPRVIPDGRFSRVQLATLTFPNEPSLLMPKLKRRLAYTPCTNGLPISSTHNGAYQLYRLKVLGCAALVPAKCREPLFCPQQVLPLVL